MNSHRHLPRSFRRATPVAGLHRHHRKRDRHVQNISAGSRFGGNFCVTRAEPSPALSITARRYCAFTVAPVQIPTTLAAACVKPDRLSRHLCWPDYGPLFRLLHGERMAAERTAMRQVREVFRLRTAEIGSNEIARRVGVVAPVS
jgi:hypothetical protein